MVFRKLCNFSFRPALVVGMVEEIIKGETYLGKGVEMVAFQQDSPDDWYFAPGLLTQNYPLLNRYQIDHVKGSNFTFLYQNLTLYYLPSNFPITLSNNAIFSSFSFNNALYNSSFSAFSLRISSSGLKVKLEL